MNLILDFGNTKAKLAVFKSEEIIHFESIEGIQLSHLKSVLQNFPEIHHAILSSVIYEDELLIRFLKEHTTFTYFQSDTPIPIVNGYKTPKTLGKDRLAAAIGANAQFPNQNVLAIDAGTALKFDFVNAENKYLGGAISPGIYLRFKALYNETDKLPLIGYQEIDYLIGSSTEESILSGVVQGITAETDGIIDRYKVLYPEIKIILTGGEAVFFEKNLKNGIFADSNLVLKGLNIILEYVKQQNA